MNLKPFFRFYGAKWRVAPKYPKPQYNTIIEPFAGAAGYSVRYADHNVILADKDPIICGVWNYLIHASEDDILSLPDLVVGDDLKDCQSVDDLPVCQEAKWLIGFWINNGSATPHKRPSKWMRQYHAEDSKLFWGPRARRRIASQLRYIRHWKVVNGDYCSLENYRATWFIDPPYVTAGKIYKFGSKKLDYDKLAKWCVSRSGQVIVCENVGATWLPFVPWRTIKSNNASKTSKEAIFLLSNE